MNKRGHGFFRIILALLSLGTQITKEQPFPDTEGFTHNGIHDVTLSQNSSSSKTVQKDDGYYLDLLNGICREGWVKGRVNDVTVCLRTNADPMSWEDARDTCRNEFSFLMKMEAPVTIESKDLGDYLKEKNIDKIWTGLHEEGGFLVWDEIAPHKVRAYNDPLEEELLRRRMWNWNIEPYVNDDIDDSDDFEFQEEESHSTCGSLNLNRHYGKHVISKRAVNRNIRNAKLLQMDDVFESDHTPSPTSREIDNSPDPANARPQKPKQMNLLQFMQHLKQLAKLNTRRRLGTIHSAKDNKKYVNSQRVRMAEKKENEHEFTTNLNEAIEPVNPTEETDFFDRKRKTTNLKRLPKTPPKLFPSPFDDFIDDNSTTKGNASENFTKFDQDKDNSTSDSGVILPIPAFSTKEKAREKTDVYADDYVNYDDLILNESKKKSTQVSVLKPTPSTPYKKIKPVPTPPTVRHGKRLKMIKSPPPFKKMINPPPPFKKMMKTPPPVKKMIKPPPPVKKMIKPPPPVKKMMKPPPPVKKMIKPPTVQLETQTKSKNVTMESLSDSSEERIKNPIGIAKTLVRKNVEKSKGLSKAEKAKRITDSLAVSSEDISKEDSDEIDDISTDQNTTGSFGNLTIQNKDDGNVKNIDKLPITLDIPPLINIKKPQSKEASKDSSRPSDEGKQRQSETDEVVSRTGIESESEERVKVDSKSNKHEIVDENKKKTAKPVPISLDSEESEDVSAYLKALQASLKKFKEKAQKEAAAVSSKNKDVQKKNTVKSSTLFNTRTDYDLTESDSLLTNTKLTDQSKNVNERKTTEKAKEHRKEKANEKKIDKQNGKPIIDKTLILDIPPPPPPIMSTQRKKENKDKIKKQRTQKGNQGTKENKKKTSPKTNSKGRGLAIQLKTTGDIDDNYVKDYINALKAARKQNPLNIATKSTTISKPVRKHAKINSGTASKKVPNNETIKKPKVTSESTDRSKSSSSYSGKESSVSDSLSSENFSLEDEETHRIRDTENKRKGLNDNKSPPLDVVKNQNIKENKPVKATVEQSSDLSVSIKEDDSDIEGETSDKSEENRNDEIEIKTLDSSQDSTGDKQRNNTIQIQEKEKSKHSTANVQEEPPQISTVESESKETEDPDSEEIEDSKDKELESDDSESKPFSTDENEEKLKNENSSITLNRKINLKSEKVVKKTKVQRKTDLPTVINTNVPSVKVDIKKTIKNDDESEEEGEEKESEGLPIAQPILTTTTQSMLNKNRKIELPKSINKNAGGIVIPTQSNIIFGSMMENPKEKEREGQEALSKDSDTIITASVNNKEFIESDDKSVPVTKSQRIAKINLKNVKSISKEASKETDKANLDNKIQTTISSLESSSSSASSEIMHTSSMQSDDADDSSLLTENRESEPDDEPGKLVIDMTDKNKTDSYSSDEESVETTSSESVTLTTGVDEYETTTSSEDNAMKKPEATLSLPSTLYGITKDREPSSDSKTTTKQGRKIGIDKSSEKVSIDQISAESSESDESLESFKMQSSPSNKENNTQINSDSDEKQNETLLNITNKSNKDPMRYVINIKKSKSSEENSKEDESKEIVSTSTPVNILTTNGVVDTDETESNEEKEVFPSTTSLPFIEVINDGSGENSVIFGIKDSRKKSIDLLSAKSQDENDNSYKSKETNDIVENAEDKNDIINKLKESEESSEENSYNSSVTLKSDERKDIKNSEKDVSNSKESFISSGKEKDESNMTLATNEKRVIVSKDEDTSTSHEENVKDLTEVKNKLKTSAESSGEKSNNSEDKASSDERKDIEKERGESNVSIESGEKKGIVSTDDEASNSSEENVNDVKDITNEMKKSTKSLEEKSDNLPVKSSFDEREDIGNSKEDASNSKESVKLPGEGKGESNMAMTSSKEKDIVSNDDEASTSNEPDDSSIATKNEVSSKYVSDTTTGIENLVNDNSISKESIESEENKDDTPEKSPISEELKDSSEVKSENIFTIPSSQTSREDSNVSLEKLPNNVVNDNANEQIDMTISEESEEFSKVKSDNDSAMHKSDEKENSEKLREDASLSKSLATSEEDSNYNSAKLASFEESNDANIHIKSNISKESTESSDDGKDSTSISSDELNALNKTSKEIKSNSKEPENSNDSKEDIPMSGAEEIVGNLNTDDSISKETTEKNKDDSDENTIVENKTIYNETIGSIESNEISTEKFNDTFFDAELVNNTRSNEISSSEAAEDSNNKREGGHLKSSADLDDIIENLSKDSSSSNESAEKSDEDIPALLSTNARKTKTLGVKPKNTTESMESYHDSSSPEDDDIDPTYLRSSDENKLIKSGSYEIKDYYAEHFKHFDEPKDDEAMYMKEVNRDKMERDKNYERDISQEIPIVLEAIRNIDDSQEQTTGFQSDEAFRSLFERLSNKTRDLLAEAASKDEVRHREDQDLDLGGIRGEISDDLDMDPEDILAQEADLRAEANVKGALLPSYSKPLSITRKIDTSKANMKLSNCNVRRKSMCFTYPVTVESTASSCDSGWVGHVFHRKCYRIMRNANTIPKMQYKNAKNICEMEGGDVAHMTDGYGGRFLIMTLLKSIKEHMKELPPKDNIPPVWVNSPTSSPSCHVMTTSGPITMGCNQSIAVTICEKSANDIGVQSTGVSHSSLEIMEFTLSDKKILKCGLKNFAAELPILWFKDGRLIDIKVKKRKESILPHLGGRPISSLPEPAETPVTDLELNTLLRKTLQTSTEHPVSEEVFQGNYWCEGWKSRPFIREKSGEIFVRFKDVITFVGRVRLPAIPYDERLLHNKIEKNLPPIMNIMTDLRFINEIVFRKLQQEFPNLESISAYPGDISSKPPLQLSYNIYIKASKNYTIADEIPLFKSLRSRYQEILMDGNILTRLPRGTPIRFIRSIRIRSTVSCQQTELRDPRTRLVANFFPAGIKLNVSSIEVCENGEKAGKATCKGDFRSGAYWGNIQIRQGCGISEPQITEDTHDDSSDLTDSEEAVEEYENLVQKMTPEERLKELAEMDIEENNLESIIEETAEITDTVEDIKENDLEYINEIMEKSAESEGKTKFVALKAIQTVNRLLTMDDTVFEKAKKVSSIIKNFEKIVEDTELSDDGYFRLVLPNVAMEIYELEKHNKPVIGMAAKTDEYGNVMYTPFNQKRIVTIYNDSAFYEDVDVAIHLPPELVHDTKAENKSRLYMMVYRDGNMFQDSSFPISVAEAPQVIKSHDLKKLNSFVISASIGGKKIEGLKQKVKTIFRPLKDPAGRTRTCAFYNFTMNNNAGGWSSAGCVYDGQVNGRDICLCDHLTNFAVLVDFYGQEDRVERVHEISLSIISLIGLSLSIIGLSLTIISFVFFRKLRKGRAQQTLFNLALSMLCSWVIFLVGIKQTYHYIGCLIVAVLLHYFILASFMWMLMEAFLQYLTFVKVLGTYVTRYTLKSVIAAWGLPLIPIICILSIDFNLYKGGDHYCWMSLDAFYYGFALPIGLIILANLIVFVITVVSIFRRPQGLRSNQSKHKMAITNLQAAITSFVLLGLSWILGYFAISDARLPFQYAFTILNSLQGFFIFVLFVARKKQVREQWKMICCCIFPDQQKAQRTLSASASYPSTCSSRSTSSTSTLHHGRTERSDSCKTTTSFIGSEYDSIYTVPYARSSRESLYYRKL